MSAADARDAFEPAMTLPSVISMDMEPGDVVTLYRCLTCAGLLEGSRRAWHRDWHVQLGHVVVHRRRPAAPSR